MKPGDGKDATARADKSLTDKLARDRVTLENEERRARRPRVGLNIYYNEVQKKLESKLFLSLGAEGNKRFLQKKTLMWKYPKCR